MENTEIEYYRNWFMTSKFELLQRDYSIKEDTLDERKHLYKVFIGRLLKEAK